VVIVIPYNNVYFLSPTGLNSNTCTYNAPCLDVTNIPQNSIVILKDGTYNVINSHFSQYLAGYLSFLKDFNINNYYYHHFIYNLRIIGENKNNVILNSDFTLTTGRDTFIIGTATNLSLENLIINFNSHKTFNYSVSLTDYSDNLSYDNIDINIVGNYSLNYYNGCASSGIVHYNNIKFNGGNLLPNYSCSQVISSTSSKPQV